jgi:hypothetical protein
MLGFCALEHPFRTLEYVCHGKNRPNEKPDFERVLTDHVWSVPDIVSMFEAAEPVPAKRGPYKKRTALAMWGQVHSVAEEIELWTSLGINCWAILTGAFLVTKVIRKSHPVDFNLLLQSATRALITICAIVAALTVLLANLSEILRVLQSAFGAFH